MLRAGKEILQSFVNLSGNRDWENFRTWLHSSMNEEAEALVQEYKLTDAAHRVLQGRALFALDLERLIQTSKAKLEAILLGEKTKQGG